MIRFLANLLIPNPSNTADPAVRRSYGILCGVVGILLNALLFAVKFLAGLLTGSIAVMADAYNNLSDAGSSLITLIGFRLSGKRVDPEHPFGHGRAEYVTGLIVAMLIIHMGLDLARDSLSMIFNPEPVAFNVLSLIILSGSILVKLYMAFYNRAIGKRIHSVAMAATAADSLSDAVATLAVLICALIGRFTGHNIDAYAGALVSLMILKAGYDAARDTISPLLGNPPEPEFVEHVEKIVNSYDGVCGIHDLVVHDYGAGRVMISLHAEVPVDGDLMAMHDMIDTIERQLTDELGCHAVIHMDPIATDDAVVTQARARVEETLKREIDPGVTVHDFRMVTGPTHTNVIFDAVIPLSVTRTEAQMKADIAGRIRDMEENWFAVVTIDRPYVG